METPYIVIQKNRGWRGLAKLEYHQDKETVHSMVFSFSQPVWESMQSGLMVLSNNDEIIVVEFDNTDALPKGQRSVLIKNFTANVIKETRYLPDHYRGAIDKHDIAIDRFKRNNNQHTLSDWNYVGIRVRPEI